MLIGASRSTRVWVPCLFLGICCLARIVHAMSIQVMKELRTEVEDMFFHGFDNYMQHSFPEDEIRPISCQPLVRDSADPENLGLNDVLANYSLTLIDSLSTLAVLASKGTEQKLNKSGSSHRAFDAFQGAIELFVSQYGDGSEGIGRSGSRATAFDLDSKVQVFETVIRGVGGLLSAHLFAIGQLPISGYNPRQATTGRIEWSNGFIYDGQLLRLAEDLARRLLPAFVTPTGIPYPRVNLRHGVPFYLNSKLNQDPEVGQCSADQPQNTEVTETCSAGAGSLILEFTTLSRLLGDPVFESLAKKAFWAIWERRSSINLVGSGIDAETGLWITPYTGIGAGIDSFYEYAAKASVFMAHIDAPDKNHLESFKLGLGTHEAYFSEDQDLFRHVWQESHAAIKRHLRRHLGHIHPHYIQGDLFTGASRAIWLDSLSAFYPAVLAMMGDQDEAIEIHMLLTALWSRYSALPERWSPSTGSVEMDLGWWEGRPEFVESTYYLYRTTRDPWYLYVGEMIVRDIQRRCWAPCGWAGLQDVRTGEQSDRMQSFFLSETFKYLYLLFDEDHPLNRLDASFVYSTEGHPLIIRGPRQKSSAYLKSLIDQSHTSNLETNIDVCPAPPRLTSLTGSSVTNRSSFFHAAHLARLPALGVAGDSDNSKIDEERDEVEDQPHIIPAHRPGLRNTSHYPWTLPIELMPNLGVSDAIRSPTMFEIAFATNPEIVINSSPLIRVKDGILVTSTNGLRLTVVQDMGADQGEQIAQLDQHFRIFAVNGAMLGRDEQILMTKETMASVVDSQDPSFRRIAERDKIEVVLDALRPDSNEPESLDRKNLLEHNPEAVCSDQTNFMEMVLGPDFASSKSVQHEESVIEAALALLSKQVESASKRKGKSELPASEAHEVNQWPIGKRTERLYLMAMGATGTGAASMPDVEDALPPDMLGQSQGDLSWHSIYVGNEGCLKPLGEEIPRDYQVIVLKRGGCSFGQKLQNIPQTPLTSKSLQLVIIISDSASVESNSEIHDSRYADNAKFSPQQDANRNRQPFAEDEFPSANFHPYLPEKQRDASGQERRHPIPLVVMEGGARLYQLFKTRVRRIGLKRIYHVESHGIPIGNLRIV